MPLINNLLLFYLIGGFVCNTLLSIPVVFMKDVDIDMEMWIGTMLTWPYTLFKMIRQLIRNKK